MKHIALDLAKKTTQVCIRNEVGEIVEEKAVKTLELLSFLAAQPKSRVVMETCTESFFIGRKTKAMGHETIVVPATAVRALGVGRRGLKNDVRDARVLSESSVRMPLEGVHIPSEKQFAIKQEAKSRALLVKMRTKTINRVKAYFRGELKHIDGGKSSTFPERLREVMKEIPAHIESLLKTLECFNAQIDNADARLKAAAEADEECIRLMTVPGMGPVTALAFRAAIDDVSRFKSAAVVMSYFGLTPGENSSGGNTKRTRIIKAGSNEVRTLLIQGALVSRTRCRGEPMAEWANNIARKKNGQMATVALARKLCGILFAILRDKREYVSKPGAKPLPPISQEEKSHLEKMIWIEKQ